MSQPVEVVKEDLPNAQGEGLVPHSSNPASVQEDVEAAMKAAVDAASGAPKEDGEGDGAGAPAEGGNEAVIDFNKAKEGTSPLEAEAPEGTQDVLAGVEAGDLEPPPEWDAERQEIFRTVPKEAQELLLDIHTSAAAPLQTQLEALQPLQSMQAQWSPYAQQVGIPLAQVVDSVLQAEMVLRTGTPEQKRNMIGHLVQSYGVDLGQQAPAMPEEIVDDPVAAAMMPQLQQVMQGLNDLRSQVDSRFGQMQQSAAQSQQQALQSFAQEKDEKGTLLHPYYAEVEPLMEALAKHAIAGGRQTSLQEVYDSACRASPTVWPKIQAAERAAGLRERQKAAADKQRASSSVSSSPGGSRALKDDGKPDESVYETVRRHTMAAMGGAGE